MASSVLIARYASAPSTPNKSSAHSGATTVLPLKQRLGEYLANRVDITGSDAHVIGAYRGLQIAELPVRDTLLAGTLGDRLAAVSPAIFERRAGGQGAARGGRPPRTGRSRAGRSMA